jgi:hypothetical protein
MSSYINSLKSQHKNCDLYNRRRNVFRSNTNINTPLTSPPSREIYKSFVALTPFIAMKNIITIGQVFLPIGMYTIAYGFKLSASGIAGNGINNNINYGLSIIAANKFDIVQNNCLYNILFDDISTFQSFNSIAVVMINTPCTLYFNSVLDNTYTVVDTLAKDAYITAIAL